MPSKSAHFLRKDRDLLSVSVSDDYNFGCRQNFNNVVASRHASVLSKAAFMFR